MDRPKYINWIVREDGVVFEDQKLLNCYRLSYTTDPSILDDWALHIRRHYISDDELKQSLDLLHLSAEDYLRKYCIPQREGTRGPAARANDITEILLADLFEFVLDFEVPRCKQYARSGITESEHGTDVIAYKFAVNRDFPNKNDELVAIEVKARLSSTSMRGTIKSIQDAVTDSRKDEYRVALTLDYYRKKLQMLDKKSESEDIARFQMMTENPCKIQYVGAAVSSLPIIKNKIIVGINESDLSLKTDQAVFYIHGSDLMALTHQVFERCVR